MGAHTIELSDATFDETVKGSNQPVLVDFWAEWCGPCKQIAPALDEIGAEYAGRLTVGKLDIDANLEISTRFDVVSIPTLILFKDGEVVDKWIGARGKAAMIEALEKHL